MKVLCGIWDFRDLGDFNKKTHTLPKTNMAPENGWLEYDRFLLGFGLFLGANC